MVKPMEIYQLPSDVRVFMKGSEEGGIKKVEWTHANIWQCKGDKGEKFWCCKLFVMAHKGKQILACHVSWLKESGEFTGAKDNIFELSYESPGDAGKLVQHFLDKIPSLNL